MIVLLIFCNSEVYLMCLRCLWRISGCQTCICCFMYAAMYDVWCYTVNKCEYVRNGFYLSGLFIPCSWYPNLIIQNPADQAQHKWLVLPHCTWRQWYPVSLCNICMKGLCKARTKPHTVLKNQMTFLHLGRWTPFWIWYTVRLPLCQMVGWLGNCSWLAGWLVIWKMSPVYWCKWWTLPQDLN